MQKKFFAVTIIVAFIFSCRLVFAADYDWSKAQKIASKAELSKYIENGRRKGQSVFHVILTNGLIIKEPEEFLAVVSAPYVKVTHYNDQSGRRIYEILTEYPGTKVANAYLSGNMSLLTTSEEQVLFKEAVKIVNEAKKYSSPIAAELYIYNEICRRTTFYDEENKFPEKGIPKSFCTASGVLIYGKANCQGYADAFYMLGRMSGLNVGRISGNLGGTAHTWNTIEFGDGKVYCVDVTDGDTEINDKRINVNAYVCFNAPLEIIKADHSAQWEAVPNLQRQIDDRYSYGTIKGLQRADSAEAGLKLIARKFFAENWKAFCVMTPFDSRFSAKNVQNAVNYISKELAANNFPLAFTLHVKNCGKYLFFTAEGQ